jgi:PD-(D/E)XK nuclease superfamily
MDEPLNKRSCFNDAGVQFAFDSTSIGWYMDCPRKYQYSMIDRWQSMKSSVHLWWGGHFATALEHFHKYVAFGSTVEDAIIRVVHEAMIATWEYKLDSNGVPVEPRIGAPVTFFDTNKTRETLVRSIVWYFEQYKDDLFPVVILSDGKPAVELSFKLALDDGNYYCGHIDKVVQAKDDCIYPMDQKSTGSTIGMGWFSQFDLSFQMTGYTFAAKALYNLPVKGVIIDGVQVMVGGTTYQRGFTFRTDDQLNEWYDDLMTFIKNLQADTQRGYFPKNTSSCDKYGGCVFKSVCSRSPVLRKNFLAGDFYRRDQWNPLIPR